MGLSRDEAVIDPAVQAAALASTIAAGATVSGYLLTQSRARRERKATAFAQALTSARRYQDFPYRVWRRQADDAETRARLAEEQTASGMEINFHLAWLQVDAPVVGEAFKELTEVLADERREGYVAAWQSPLISDGAGMAARPAFRRHSADPELELCIMAMRNELSLLAPLHRRRIRRLVRRQAEQRATPQP
jgi:hypothetical protein